MRSINKRVNIKEATSFISSFKSALKREQNRFKEKQNFKIFGFIEITADQAQKFMLANYSYKKLP